MIVLNELRETPAAWLLVLDVDGFAYGRWIPKSVTRRPFDDVVDLPPWLEEQIASEVLTFRNAASRLAPPTTEN